MIPAEPRLPDARRHLDRGQYFVVHAPRQTGKTTTLRALANQLTSEGRYAALHFSCQSAASAGGDFVFGQSLLLDAIRARAQIDLPAELRPPEPSPGVARGRQFYATLAEWARACPRPLVLFFDEIDSLQDDSLLSVLHQLREGYEVRPDAFPASVVLCGLRDVREYKAASGGDPTRLGSASPFNILVASFRLGDFSESEVRDLYAQHTADTGQLLTDEALTRVWEYTAGQPWLVNALAREVIDEMALPADTAITAHHIDTAKERLILARATHIDSLLARLHEPRVRRIIEPLIAGDNLAPDLALDDDVSYVRDLGLIASDRPVRVANPIYREVIIRVLSTATSESVTAEPRSFVSADGRLDFNKFLHEFTDFWRANSDILTSGETYHEVAPQLVMMGFLHRIVNGGGFIDREFGIGRGRIDLLVRWPYREANGSSALQREAIEVKVWHPGKGDPLDEGLAQLDGYLRQLDLSEGTLVIFDRRPSAPPIDQRIQFSATATPSGRKVTLLRA